MKPLTYSAGPELLENGGKGTGRLQDRFILATADGCGTTEIMRRSGKSKPVYGDGRRGSWPRASRG
jgi:hypothetical protein